MAVIWIDSGRFKPPVPPLLDLYPGAAAAYSLRQLRTGVTNVVRVRRSSDNTEADFTAAQVFNGSLAAWVGAVNGFVTAWYDQSGNNNHAVQATLAEQPSIVTSGVVNTFNANPCLVHGLANHLGLTTRLTNVKSVFELFRMDFSTNPAPTILGDTTLFDYHWGSTAPNAWISATLASSSVRNGNNRINGVTTNLTTNPRNDQQVLITMIHQATATVSQVSRDRGGRYFRGSFQELLLYSTDQTANVSGIESNINAHYAIF
jgi:hypothetical protein